MIPRVLHDPKNSVAVVVVESVEAGQSLNGPILDEDRTLTCTQHSPLGPKVASLELAVGEGVIKYGTDTDKVQQW